MSYYKRKYLPLLALLIPVISLIIALIFVLHYHTEYQQAEEEYSDTASAVDSVIEHNISLVSEKPVQDIAQTTNNITEQLEQVDFYTLLQENPDVIAWITIPICGINYPVVQGSDNVYYLTHTVKKTANSSGAIFIDYENNSDFSDLHTLIYGHNMKNNSMFGGLKKIRRDPTLINESPYVYIFTPDGRMRQYQIFAMRQVESDSDAYRFFTGETYYKEYVDECIQNSVAGINRSDIMAGTPLITLSTCSGDDDRLLVHCVLKAIY